MREKRTWKFRHKILRKSRPILVVQRCQIQKCKTFRSTKKTQLFRFWVSCLGRYILAEVMPHSATQLPTFGAGSDHPMRRAREHSRRAQPRGLCQTGSTLKKMNPFNPPPSWDTRNTWIWSLISRRFRRKIIHAPSWYPILNQYDTYYTVRYASRH